MKSGLASRLKSLGRIYVLIGPGTFSSAVANAADFTAYFVATITVSGIGSGCADTLV
jgi:hypothetical protein